MIGANARRIEGFGAAGPYPRVGTSRKVKGLPRHEARELTRSNTRAPSAVTRALFAIKAEAIEAEAIGAEAIGAE